MSKSELRINSEVLKWARLRQGYSTKEVANRLEKPESLVKSWESGDSFPNYPQLEFLAYKIYKCPVAVFFFPTPPEEESLKEQFRTIPSEELDKLSSDTRYHLRQAKAFQVGLKELLEEHPVTKLGFFKSVELTQKQDISVSASKVRAALGVSISDQINWRSTDIALKHWRLAVERIGVYVFKTSFKQTSISGFCLVDETFPIIYLNNSNSKARQLFTLIHELIHVFLEADNIEMNSATLASREHYASTSIERYCNAVTSEVLVPDSELMATLGRATERIGEDEIDSIARSFSVSKEVICRRLLDKLLVTQKEYDKWTAKWNKEALKFMKDRKKGGGSYYNTLLAYLSPGFSNIIFSFQSSKRLSIEQASEYLNISPDKFEKLQAKYVESRISA